MRLSSMFGTTLLVLLTCLPLAVTGCSGEGEEDDDDTVVDTDTAADADTSSHADTDSDDDADTDTDEGIDCGAIDVDTCKTESSCDIVYGYPVLDRDGDGVWCVEKDDGPMALGCVDADADCPYSAAWRTPGGDASDECYLFGSCTPSGWGNCPNPDQHITDEC